MCVFGFESVCVYIQCKEKEERRERGERERGEKRGGDDGCVLAYLLLSWNFC